jgi:hypothetical protein
MEKKKFMFWKHPFKTSPEDPSLINQGVVKKSNLINFCGLLFKRFEIVNRFFAPTVDLPKYSKAK